MLSHNDNHIIAIYTDSEPDHRTDLISEQTSLICLFLKEDRDVAVVVKDPAKRVMSHNLGAQAVGLMREKTDIENLVSTCSGLKALGKLQDENPALEV